MNNQLTHPHSATNLPVNRHKKQVLWQIYLPLGLSAAFALAALILVIVFSNNSAYYDISKSWSAISAIFIVLVSILPMLLILTVLGGLIYGLTKLIQVLPFYSLVAQHYLFIAAIAIHEWSDRFAHPVVQVQGWKAGAETLAKSLPRPSRNKVL